MLYTVWGTLSSVTIFLGILAGLLQIFGYIVYFKKIKGGFVQPNTASWSIWAFGAILESASYIVSTGDWIKNFLPIACALSAITFFVLCLRRGHFGRITKFEFVLVLMDCVAIFVWWLYSSAAYANIFLVFTAVVSFMPIILGVWKDPKNEDARPWYIWTLAYVALTLVVLFRWQKWSDLIYPLVFAVLHILVAVLAVDRRVARKTLG